MTRNEQLAQIAKEAAQIGGKTLVEYYGRVDPDTIQTKKMGDWVSAADKASEEKIVKFLSRELPDDEVLTEETDLIRPSVSSGYRWIIDPLDGTTNFLRRIPIWSVSVALEDRNNRASKWGDIVAGAVYIPQRQEHYWAAEGVGAYCNDERLEVAPKRSFDECLLATGFPFRTRHLVDQYMGLFAKIMKNCADVRRMGAVTVDLCYTAAGIFDGFWELDLGPWDIAAGSLIIREAGGLVGNFQGGDDFLKTGDIVAGSPTLFPQLLAMVREFFPEERDVDKAPI